MPSILVALTICLLVAVIGLAFLVLGALRALGLVHWRLDQLELTRPSRLGRDGLKVGKRAPDFTLPATDSRQVSLHDFAGRKVLLVFTQSGCAPCHEMAPEFNRVHAKGEYQVLVVNNGEPDETRQWAEEIRARFPVLIQEKFSLAKRYEIFVTPFAFVIDELGTITSSGIANSVQYLGYVLSSAGHQAKEHHVEPQQHAVGLECETLDTNSQKELGHVATN